jgi:cytochrome c biogenesis protein CcmG/thiol:disulfide interchange protein DsbE
MKTHILGRLAIFVLALSLIVGCSKSVAIEIGEKAPEFTLQDTDGNNVNLSDFKGDAVILNFFASWCPPCRQEVPDFIELQNKYAAEGFSFIGISLVSAEDTKSFAKKMGVNYPMLIDDGVVSAVYGPVRSIPTTYILDRGHKIVKMYIGSKPKAVFENDIKALLK